MKDMVKEYNVTENIGETEIREAYREQLFDALDKSYQSLQQNRLKGIEVQNITPQTSSCYDSKDTFLQSLKDQILKAQAKMEFRSTKEGKKIVDEALSRALHVNLKEKQDITSSQELSSTPLEVVKKLQFILKNLDDLNEEQLRNSIHLLDQMKKELVNSNQKEKWEILEAMSEVRSRLFSKLFQLKQIEQKESKKYAFSKK